MAFPKRTHQHEAVEPATTHRPAGPVLFENDPTPATATAVALAPPPRIPPGIAATDSLPDPADEGYTGAPLFNYRMPDYIEFNAALFAPLAATLLFLVAAGLLAVAASFR